MCLPELQWFCASGSTRPALLTHIHPGPYHLEDIMGNAWQGSLTPPRVVLNVALINWPEHLWMLASWVVSP